MSHWVSQLNPEQAEAALHNEGPMLILAGAGSGKTTVLVARTGRLIEEGICRAKEICILTFTNKAAKEMQDRVTKKLGKKLSKGLWAGTFHSFGLQVLRQYHKEAKLPKNFGILGQGDQVAIVKEILKSFSAGKDSYDCEKLISLMSDWRSNGQSKAKEDEEYQVACEWLLPKYIKRLEHLGVVDFDELLLGPIRLAETHPEILYDLKSRFRQLMVDEFQDTNRVQMKLVLLLSAKYQNISVVGDDDQSIYGWRGAEISNILNFPRLFESCKVVRLERNYRSTPSILKVANAVIEKNTERHRKILRSDISQEEGEKPEFFVFENEDEEAERVCQEIEQQKAGLGLEYDDFAILYRSNSQGALVEAELRKGKIPYKIHGGTAFFDRRETKDILAYLRCSIQPNELALRRIINTPPRSVGETSVDQILQYAEGKQLSFEKATRAWKEAGVNEKSGGQIDNFFLSLDSLVEKLLSSADGCGQALLRFMSEIGYKSFVEKLAKDQKAASMRWSLVEIFCNVLDSFVEQGGKSEKSLQEFIDAMELRDQISEAKEEESIPKVQLMTFHASKGLEFPVCFMIGIEEDLIPHKSLGGDISEERRLFYVAVTRAKKKLILSRAKERRKYGRMAKSAPSRFLLEIPEDLLQRYELGFRPMTAESRADILAQFMGKLDKRIDEQKIK